MQISFLFLAAALFMLIYTSWMVGRNARPNSWRSQHVNPMLALVAMAELMKGMTLAFSWDQLFRFFFVGIILWTLVAPLFRKPEEDLDGKPNSLRD